MRLAWTLAFTCLAALPGTLHAGDGLVAGFAEPKPEFSPVPIWWWSGDPITPEGIRDQIHKIAAGHIHNAIILNLAPSGTLYGSAPDEPPFLSERWWDLFKIAVETGKEAGVRIWFYDQLGFSGAGLQARVVRDNPEFRSVSLAREMQDVTGPAEVEIPTPPQAEPLAAFVGTLTEGPAEAAKWIWDKSAPEQELKRYFRRAFDLDKLPARAHLNITCDNGYTVYINGAELGTESSFGAEGWGRAESFDLLPHLRKGGNVVAVAAENLGGQAGLLVEVVLDDAASEAEDGAPVYILSDSDFRMSAQAPKGWLKPKFDDAAWPSADVLGSVPMPPWGAIAGIQSGDPFSLGTPIANVHDISAQIKDGVLHASVPGGRHRVQLFYTTPGTFDYLNPEACAALLDVVHGEMERRFSNELGKGIAGSFQDEFPAVPRFSRRFLDEFPTRAGYGLLDRLPALYDDMTDLDGPSTIQVRCDASRVAAEMAEEAFFKPLHEWHEKYGMLCGYDQTVRNADPMRGEDYYVDYFKTMRHYSAPGNDMDGDCKPHQSIADLYGRPRVWIEAFHSSGWGQTIEETATLLHPWLAEGATLFDPHAIYYSIHGSYWEWAPPDTGWRQPYFVHYPELADYVSRLCYVLSQGVHVVDTAILHPASTVHAFRGFGSPSGFAKSASDEYWRCQVVMRAERLDYIIIDEDSIANATIDGGELKAGSLRLRIIVLPSARVLACATLLKLAEFQDAGGCVIVIGHFPEFPADRALTTDAFKERATALLGKAVCLETHAGMTEAVIERAPRHLAEKRIELHRRADGRDFHFVLSDDGTAANGGARWDINSRKLWETEAARCARIPLTFARDGVPEFWNAATGEVTPILNYERADGHTLTHVDLGETAAPLIALRPPVPEDPLAIESGLQIIRCRRDGGTVNVTGLAPGSVSGQVQVRVAYDDAVFKGTAHAKAPNEIALPGPYRCRLAPTCDNADGSFAWPPSEGTIPVEVRAMRFNEEGPDDDVAQWASPDYNDSEWDTVLASFGPRAEWAGPIELGEADTFETMTCPNIDADEFKPAEYSLRLGIDEDPVFSSSLGGKGRIPGDFIDLGNVRRRDVYVVRATVTLPEGANATRATLRIGGVARKRAFLNGLEVRFSGDAEASVLRSDIVLRPGANRLVLLATRGGSSGIRLYYQLLPAGGVPPDPEWIWVLNHDSSGKATFTKTIEVSGAIKSASMVVALGDLHKIRVNGELIADQGNFDAYFMSRAERYDIAPFLRPGTNEIAIEARDPGHPVGVLLDGLVTLETGREITFVSDASFTTGGNGPVRIQPGPARGYMGDPQTLLLRPRPHPLPLAGWLVDQPQPRPPFDKIVYSIDQETPPPGWYRFLLPPGASALSLRTHGDAALYVNGRQVAIEGGAPHLAARLPDPAEPKRLAALRIESVYGFERGAALLEPITFKVGEGTIPLGSWDELGLPHYAGGLQYTMEFDLPEGAGSYAVLDLGRVRGSAAVTVNGQPGGTRVWHPYRFDISGAVKVGSNRVEVRVFNTLGPHFAAGHPSAHVYEGHTKSGIFGPITVTAREPVVLELKQPG